MKNTLRPYWKEIYRFGKFICLFFLCFSLAVACNNNPSTTGDGSNNRTNNDRIAIGTTLKVRTLDPADSYELSGLNIIYNVGQSLYTYKLGSTKLQPLLAQEMPQISDDGLTYTIPLRQGVKFHDGTPFNAEAMKFSLQRFRDNGGKPSFLLSDIDTIEATEEYLLTIKLKQPFAAFQALLAFPGTAAVSPSSYELGEGKFDPNKLVGTGRYKLVDFSSNGIRLDVFEDYWGDKPENQGVDIQIYPGNSANLFNSFRTNAVDVAYQTFDPDQIESLRKDAQEGKWQDIEAPGTAVSFMSLNRNQKPLDKLEVRQAIASIVDRNLLNQRALQGQGEPIYSLIPTAFDAYKPVFKEKYGNVNVEKAKQLLSQAGYSAANPITVEIWHPSGSNIRAIVAATLKALAERQLDGAIEFVPSSVEGATAFANLAKGIYPSFLSDWYPDFLDADNYIQPFLQCNEGNSQDGCQKGGAATQGSFYYNEEINQLIDKQRKEQDPEKRQEIFGKIQEILAKDVPYIPLWQTKDYAFSQNGITGVTINPSQNFPLWTIKRN